MPPTLTSQLDPLARASLEFALGLRRARVEASRARRGLTALRPRPPLGIERSFTRELVRVSREFSTTIGDVILPQLRGVQIGDLFPLEQDFQNIRLRLAERVSAFEASPILDQYGQRLNRHNLEDTARVLRLSPDNLPQQQRDVLESFRRENVELIGSIAETQLDQVQDVVRTATRTGRRVEQLAKDVEGRFGVSESRARLIARDQVAKANAQMTQVRQTAAGITRYIWNTSGDERVRETHAELNGQTFEWTDPPVTNANGDRNHPGEDYQCRCVALPVLDLD